ncbi:MAG: lysophospholipid acyltransferase family protein [Vicingaceae bacterium]
MGTKLLYYLFLLPLSKLPFGALYVLSDLTYFVLYKLVGYRTKVVRGNIERSFPKKSKEEVLRVEREFYKHLCDVIVEGIKGFSISKKQAQKRMKQRNPELINQFYDQGKQVILAGGHYGNWELFAVAIGMALEYKTLALYTPLKNQFMDQKVRGSRSKYGLQMMPINEIKKKLNSKLGDLYTIIFGADQSPRKSQKAYWMSFLDQETGVQYGTEKFAKEYKAAVVFGNIHRIKRGHYEVAYQLICEDASKTEYGYVTQAHTKLLEKEIRQKPEHWLWSHKRWKHKRPDDMPMNEDLNLLL